MVLAAVWFHYLQAMKNNIIKVINIIKRQWPHSSCDGREKVFSFLFYFFFVSHGSKLLFEMSIVTVTLIFDTYIQGCLFCLADLHISKNILDTKMHFQEENWLFRKIQRCNMSCQISVFHFFISV